MNLEINEQLDSNEKKFSRSSIYLISIGASLFYFFLLSYLIPLLSVFSTTLTYFTIILLSFILCLLLKSLLKNKNDKDFIILPAIISSLGGIFFGFLKYFTGLIEQTNKSIDSILLSSNPSLLSMQSSIPNIDLLFILFFISFNILFIYKYLKSPNKKYTYLLLYLIPLLIFIVISMIINCNL